LGVLFYKERTNYISKKNVLNEDFFTEKDIYERKFNASF